MTVLFYNFIVVKMRGILKFYESDTIFDIIHIHFLAFYFGWRVNLLYLLLITLFSSEG